MLCKKVVYEGRVQGVGFRYCTRQLAMEFDVVGNVRNLVDGSVELNVMGEDSEVEEFLFALKNTSAVGHYIKAAHENDAPLLENAKGFVIA